jgi:hypothetical protein
MRLSIFKNGENDPAIPYVMSVSLDGDLPPPDVNFIVPVYFERSAGGFDSNGHSEHYAVEICGFRLEAHALEDLYWPTSQLLNGLINLGRLPTYIFAAGHSMLIYPVYIDGDEVFATTPGGPVFRHVELAKVRSYLSDYLHTMEELGTPGAAETLHVRGIDNNTLGLLRPVFYLKKRVLGETDFWAPVFKTPDGRSVYTYAASARRSVPVDSGREVMDLHAIVAEALMADRRLNDPLDLRPDRLFPANWLELQALARLQPYTLSYLTPDRSATVTLPLHRYGKSYLAAEHRAEEDRYNLYLGQDPVDIRNRVAADLVRRKLIRSFDEVDVIAL